MEIYVREFPASGTDAVDAMPLSGTEGRVLDPERAQVQRDRREVQHGIA